MNHREVIQSFYTAFAQGNAEGMISHYHKAIQFNDPAFGHLHGDEVQYMWKMLIERSKGDLQISFSAVDAYDNSGSANWKAEYTFSPTGRKVINRVSASFKFEGDKIIRHTDDFDLWKWSQQALGWKGYLLGWTDFLQKKSTTAKPQNADVLY